VPLRVASVETAQTAAPRSPREWQRAIARVTAAASGAVRSGDADALRRSYEDAAAFEDPHRVFQARKLVTEAVFGQSQVLAVEDWRRLYAAAAETLFAVLAGDPLQPVFLNYAGVLVYELGEAAAAEQLFKAALRLDQSLPHVQKNLAAARGAKRAQQATVAVGPAALARKSREAQARRVAAAAQPAKGLRLSLCMIVKDEEEMLPGCLAPVADAVDEIIVVDTGSSDRTVEIAESFGAKVLHFPWNGSFSDARNVGLDAATGDWLMYLDADEHMEPGDARKLRSLVGRTWREGFHLVETNYTGDEDTGTAVTHLALRVFRNRPEYRFEGKIHEQKSARMPNYLPERFEATSIRLRHYGYLKNRISAKEKSRRNIELLLEEARENPTPFTEFNLGSEYMMLGDAKRSAEHFDRSWEQLHAGEQTWTSAGYAPILASRIAMARRAAGRIDDAREALEVGIAAMPDHTDLYLELAHCARAEGNLEEAERLVRHCLALGDAPARYTAIAGSGTFLALSFLAELAEKAGRPDEAAALYLQALAEHPSYPAPVLPAATLLVRRGAGLEDLRQLLPLDRPSASLLAGTACLEAGRLDEATVLFTETLEKQPSNDAARIGLAEAHLAGSDWAAAAAAAGEVPVDSVLAAVAAGEILFAHAAAGDEPSLQAALVDAEERGLGAGDRSLYGAWADVIAGRTVARTLPPTALATAATALEALLRVKAFVAFGQLATVAEKLSIPVADRRDVLASIYLRRGFLDSAAEEWMTSVQEQPSARALVGLAQVAYARSLAEDAVVFAEHALMLDPGHEQAQLLLERLRRRAA
jgi:glycosyltransferase involved in cell wall biosynthesis